MVTQAYPFQGRYLELDGQRYHYLDEGQGPALLLVHGNPSWSFLWRELIPELSRDFRCIAPDHIGMGRSDKPDDRAYPYTLERRVADLGQLIDHLDLEDLSLIMHDWGGMIGSSWAVDHPARVRSIVAMNTSAFPLPADKPVPMSLRLARTPLLGALLVRGMSAFSRGANRYCVTRAPLRPEAAAGFLEPYDSWDHRRAVHRFVQDIPLDPGHPSWERVQRTAAGMAAFAELPMLLCWGMQDFVFDAHFLAEWEARFPGAEVHRFADAGHYLLEDAGAEVIPLVAAFLRRHLLA